MAYTPYSVQNNEKDDQAQYDVVGLNSIKDSGSVLRDFVKREVQMDVLHSFLQFYFLEKASCFQK